MVVILVNHSQLAYFFCSISDSARVPFQDELHLLEELGWLATREPTG
jgi:hypothetical protein